MDNFAHSVYQDSKIIISGGSDRLTEQGVNKVMLFSFKRNPEDELQIITEFKELPQMNKKRRNHC